MDNNIQGYHPSYIYNPNFDPPELIKYKLLSDKIKNNNEQNNKQNNKIYDPYLEYLNNNGLLNNIIPQIKYIDNVINVDSRKRKKNNTLNISSSHILNNNPMTLTLNNEIEINVSNIQHIFNKNDLIAINNIRPTTVILKTYANGIYYIEFIQGLDYIKIKSKYNFDIDLLGNNIFNYDTSNMTVKLSGIKSGIDNENYIGNIPINYLNGIHRIYTFVPNNENDPNYTPSNDYFFIKLNIPFQGTGLSPSNSYNFEL